MQFYSLALVAKDQRKSTKHNESTLAKSPVVICQEGTAVTSGGADVNVQPRCDPTSTEGVSKAVTSEEHHTSSLDDKNIICSDSKNSYSYSWLAS